MKVGISLIQLALISSISIEIVAIYLSVNGLYELFGKSTPIIFFALTIEFCKVILTFMTKKFSQIKFVLRTYFTVSIFFMSLITSVGVYSFLIKQFSTGIMVSERNSVIASSLVDRIKTEKENNENLKKAYFLEIERQEKRNQLMFNSIQSLQSSKDSSFYKASIAQKRASEMVKILREDTLANQLYSKILESEKRILEFSDSLKKIELIGDGEQAAFFSIAKILGISFSTFASLLSLFLVLVFEPMAILLILLYNSLSNEEKKLEKEEYQEDNSDNENNRKVQRFSQFVQSTSYPFSHSGQNSNIPFKFLDEIDSTKIFRNTGLKDNSNEPVLESQEALEEKRLDSTPVSDESFEKTVEKSIEESVEESNVKLVEVKNSDVQTQTETKIQTEPNLSESKEKELKEKIIKEILSILESKEKSGRMEDDSIYERMLKEKTFYNENLKISKTPSIDKR